MDPVVTSAENTDLDESFEDATEAKDDLNSASSPTTVESESDEKPHTPASRPSLDSKSNETEKTDEDAEDEDEDGDELEEEESSEDAESVSKEVPDASKEEVVPQENRKSIQVAKAGLITEKEPTLAAIEKLEVLEIKSEIKPTPPRLSRRSFDTDKSSLQPPISKTLSNTSDHSEAAARPTPRSRFPTFAAALPSVPWGPPPKRSNEPSLTVAPPAGPSTVRKGGMTPFGWLTRSTSYTPKSPPLPAKHTDLRRNTSASMSTTGSGSELTLKGLDEVHEASNERKPAQPSLRERFKMLRLREETGGKYIDEVSSNVGKKANTDRDRRASQSQQDEEKRHSSGSTGSVVTHQSTGHSSEQTNGTSSSEAAPIDWDFWQSVVNEGPQAVARTSPEELAHAISSGIPQTIRGVIWQVLAGSKNEDLETVYDELRVRGTKDEIKDHITQTISSTVQPPSGSKERDSVASSRSSVRSDHSTPATSANVGPASPTPSHEHNDSLHSTKMQAQLTSERSKKAKEDAAALIKLEKMIKKDLGARTSYSKYTTAPGLQDGLFNVCKSYALFDESVGYPQGMNFIIMPLLFVMSEEEAFCLLVRLMNKYQLREMFIQDMPGLHLHLYQFERLLEDFDPALYVHLNRRGVVPKLYATQWFLTLFAYRFPLQLVMRVYDLILCEGLESAIFKIGLAVIHRNAATLLSMNDMQALTTFLKERLFDIYIDQTPSSKSILESGFFGSSAGADAEVYRADILVREACDIKLMPETLAKYREEWEEKTKAEKARETELENLRTEVTTKAAQIRSLEQRAEKSDSEQIEIANELVRLKVENSELIDDNETLKGQVDELRKVAASEAANVEQKMRAGTELVMQRNIEVQNENRHMEEQMAEMERELVAMKMKYAELDHDHEALKQRWNDLKKALG